MSAGEHKWVTVFLEVALRAIRRVHLEYGIWGAGRQWKTGPGRPSLINMGPGIELADERAVCAAITQEFMVSPSLTGLWRGKGKTDVRFFAISREELYKSRRTKRAEKVDLFIEKCQQTRLGKFKVIEPPSLIEAKRARRWQINLKTGRVKPYSPRTQIKAVLEDVLRLQDERKARKPKPVYIHLLVWGLYGDRANDPLDHPTAFFQEVRRVSSSSCQLSGPYVRWLPMKWDSPANATKSENPIVRSSAWVALAEVDRPPKKSRSKK
jgi:hypothetical protein